MKRILLLVLFFATSSFIRAQNTEGHFTYQDSIFKIHEIKNIYGLSFHCCKNGRLEKDDEIIDSLFQFIKKHKNLSFEISFHTDSRGSVPYNNKFSQFKAEQMMNLLVDKGVQKERLKAVGYGESKPIVLEDEINNLNTEEEREKAHLKNRRYQLKIININ